MIKQGIKSGLLGALALSFTLLNPVNAQAEQEDWYWGFDLGYAVPNWASLSTSGATSRLPLGGSLYFYWPILDGTTAIGVATASIMDNYNVSLRSTSVSVYTIGASIIHTFGPEPMVGPFARADLGIGYLSISTSGLTVSSKIGLGAVAALGYGFALSDTTRLPLSARFVYESATGSTGFSFNVGLLF